MDGSIDRSIDGSMDEWMSGWMDEWMHQWVNEYMDGCMDAWKIIHKYIGPHPEGKRQNIPTSLTSEYNFIFPLNPLIFVIPDTSGEVSVDVFRL